MAYGSLPTVMELCSRSRAGILVCTHLRTHARSCCALTSTPSTQMCTVPPSGWSIKCTWRMQEISSKSRQDPDEGKSEQQIPYCCKETTAHLSPVTNFHVCITFLKTALLRRTIKFMQLKVQCSDFQYIHAVVRPSPQSGFRMLLSPPHKRFPRTHVAVNLHNYRQAQAFPIN